uniref:Elongation of very long chain fatty acids protein n=1 Tax=Xenopsylla cheopis TaxID=163159 RepID=A0A6M2DXV9_XENCH
MVFLAWLGVKFLPGGHGMAICVVNCFVHSVMYFYYFLTAMKPELKSNPWWKKYITQMQLFQFLMMTLHFGQLAIQPNCGYPAFTAAAFVPQNFFMLMLFSDFYYRAYIKRKPDKQA